MPLKRTRSFVPPNAITALLVIASVGACDAKSVLEISEAAKFDSTRVQLTMVKNALDYSFVRYREYPEKLQTLVDARSLQANQLVDAWQQPLVYSNANHTAKVCSNGPDKKPATADDLCESADR